MNREEITVLVFAIMFLIAIILAFSTKHEEDKPELNVKAKTEPQLEYKSNLDPFTAENTKPKRKYKQRKSASKVRAEEAKE